MYRLYFRCHTRACPGVSGGRVPSRFWRAAARCCSSAARLRARFLAVRADTWRVAVVRRVRAINYSWLRVPFRDIGQHVDETSRSFGEHTSYEFLAGRTSFATYDYD